MKKEWAEDPNLKLYYEQIEPHLDAILKICAEHHLPTLLSVQLPSKEKPYRIVSSATVGGSKEVSESLGACMDILYIGVDRYMEGFAPTWLLEHAKEKEKT